jgi:hypothetical protein
MAHKPKECCCVDCCWKREKRMSFENKEYEDEVTSCAYWFKKLHPHVFTPKSTSVVSFTEGYWHGGQVEQLGMKYTQEQFVLDVKSKLGIPI